MSNVIEKVRESKKLTSEKHFYRVFLSFRKPDGAVSLFFGDGSSGCGVYAALSEIFKRPPKEIYEVMSDLAFRKGDGFMQEYLSLENASEAIASASLFALRSGCICFLKQGANFYIKENKK